MVIFLEFTVVVLTALGITRHLLPVHIEVQHGQVVAKRGGQAFSWQGVFLFQDAACLRAFLQEHHRPTVVRSGRSRHHRQLALLGQSLP